MHRKWIVSLLLLTSVSAQAMDVGTGLKITVGKKGFSPALFGLTAGATAGGIVGNYFMTKHNEWVDKKQAEYKKQQEEKAAAEAEAKKVAERQEQIDRACQSQWCKTHPDYVQRQAAEQAAQAARDAEQARLQEHKEKFHIKRIRAFERAMEDRSTEVITDAVLVQESLENPKVQEHISKNGRKFLLMRIRAIQDAALNINDQEMSCFNGKRAQLWILNYLKQELIVIHDISKGIADGVYDGFYKTADLMREIYQDPRIIGAVTKGLVDLASRPEDFWNHAKGALVQYYDLMANGSAYEISHAGGEFIANVAQAYLIPGAAGFESASLAMAAMKQGLHKFPIITTKIVEPVIKQLEQSPIKSDIEKVKKLVAKERQAIADLREHRIKSWTSAKEANAEFVELGYQGPYQKGTQVIDFVTKRDTKYVRLYGPDTKSAGSWVMPASAIEGLTAEQLQIKYSLPFKPTHIVEVHVPKDTLVVRGRVRYLYLDKGLRELSGVDAAGLEGSIQYRLPKWEKSWFKNHRPID